MTGEFAAQIASNAENVSIWWRHHATPTANFVGPTLAQRGSCRLPRSAPRWANVGPSCLAIRGIWLIKSNELLQIPTNYQNRDKTGENHVHMFYVILKCRKPPETWQTMCMNYAYTILISSFFVYFFYLLTFSLCGFFWFPYRYTVKSLI